MKDPMPKVVGLCPEPTHRDDFYVPHGGGCPLNGTQQGEVEFHSEQLVVYVRLGDVVEALSHYPFDDSSPADFIEREFTSRRTP